MAIKQQDFVRWLIVRVLSGKSLHLFFNSVAYVNSTLSLPTEQSGAAEERWWSMDRIRPLLIFQDGPLQKGVKIYLMFCHGTSV